MPKYSRGEKVFAKVRGYPPWPARVEGVADETPNKMKYHIYFYGTAETAICKADELFPYVENRAKYGKPLKKRGFNEALQQVDEELGLTGMNLLENSITDDSIAETSITGDEASITSIGNAGNISKESLHKTETPKVVRRKSDVQENVEPETKRPKVNSNKKSKTSTDQLQTPAPTKHQEVVSRSGRKIKPKKFADEQVDENSGSAYASTNHSTPVANVNKSVDDKSAVSNNDVKTNVPEQKLIGDSAANNGEKHKKETEEKQKEETQVKHKKETKEKHSTVKQNNNNGTEELVPESLSTEAEILRIDMCIKESLDLKIAHPQKALDAMDEFLELKLTSLMFKKHPEVVDTARKLCKYVGCVKNWNMSDDEVRSFQEKAAQIQEKSKKMYDKIKSLFPVPDGKSFTEYFEEQIAEFTKKTENWNEEDIYKLTVDPTEEKDA